MLFAFCLFGSLLALGFYWRLHWAFAAFIAQIYRLFGVAVLSKNALKWQYFKPWNQGVTVYGPHKYRLSVQESMKHILVIGGSGAGKTTSIIMPSVLQLGRSGHSMLVFDPSGEILARTRLALEDSGYTVQILNLIQPAHSQKYNPLAKVQSALEIGELSRILIRSAQMDKGDPFWHYGAEQLLEVVIHAVINRQGEATLSQALALLQRILEPETHKQLSRNLSPQVQNQLTALLTANPRVLSSFHAVALNSLKMLNLPEMGELLSESELDFSLMRKEKQAIFLLLPIEKISYYGFIMNLFYTQFFNAMMARLPLPGERKVFALLDEFAHARIEEMDTIAAVIRKYDVSLTLVVQSLAQLQTRYGLRAKTLLQNCQTRVILGGVDAELKTLFNLRPVHTGQRVCQLNGSETLVL